MLEMKNKCVLVREVIEEQIGFNVNVSPTKGEVVASAKETDYEVGDIIYFGKDYAVEIQVDGEILTIVREQEIFAKQ